MSDGPFYAPNHTTAPRQRQPSEHLWAVRKDGRQLDCQLRDHGAWGVEVQAYRECELLYGRRDPRAGAHESRGVEGPTTRPASCKRGRQHRYADQQAAVMMVITDSDAVQVHLHRAMAAGLRCPLPTDLDDAALGARLFASLPTIHH
jgi:hypothetical protein